MPHRDFSRLIDTVRRQLEEAEQEVAKLHARLRRVERAQLLADLLAVWPDNRHSVPSATLRDLLREMPDRHYRDWPDDMIGQRALREALGADVRRVKVRHDEGTVNGYRRGDIARILRDLGDLLQP